MVKRKFPWFIRLTLGRLGLQKSVIIRDGVGDTKPLTLSIVGPPQILQGRVPRHPKLQGNVLTRRGSSCNNQNLMFRLLVPTLVIGIPEWRWETPGKSSELELAAFPPPIFTIHSVIRPCSSCVIGRVPLCDHGHLKMLGMGRVRPPKARPPSRV